METNYPVPSPDTLLGGGESTIFPEEPQAVEAQSPTIPFDPLAALRTPNQQNRIEAIRKECVLAGPSGLTGGTQNFSAAGEYKEELIAWLIAKGMTASEVATHLGYSRSTVQGIVTKPSFKLRIREKLAEVGRPALQAVLETEALPSVETLIKVRDDPKEKGSTRVLAANSILDRFLGKPIAKVESETKITDRQASAEIDALNQELAQVNAQLKASGVLQPN